MAFLLLIRVNVDTLATRPRGLYRDTRTAYSHYSIISNKKNNKNMLVNIIWRNRPIFYDKYHKNSPYISVLLYSKNCLKNKHH